MPIPCRNRFGGAPECAAGVLTATRFQGSGADEWLNYRHQRRDVDSADARDRKQDSVPASVELQKD